MYIKDTIYLDHQATTPVDCDVLSKMWPYYSESFGNPHSIDHSIGWRAAHAVNEAAEKVARLIGADADEIVFTSGATEANNLALLGLGTRASEGRQRILISAIEHKCVLEASRILRNRFGFRIDLLHVDSAGRVDLEYLRDSLDDDVLVVSIMAVNNEIGTIQDIPTLNEIIATSGALFHCDAAQAPCAIELNEISRFVDLLSLSGHKMYGPQGIGVLFVRRDLQSRIEPLIHGGGQQQNLRSGTLPVPLCVGLGAAAEQFQSTCQDSERKLLRKRRNIFVDELMKLPYPVSLNGPNSNQRHPGNANICFEGYDAQDILSLLQPRIAASTGSACTSGISEPSHVLQSIGLSHSQVASSIRFSLGRDTTEECIYQAITFICQSMQNLSRDH